MAKTKAEIVTYLMGLVDTTSASPCWLWTGNMEPNGYGRVMVNYVRYGAHRAVYEFLVEPVPAEMYIDHLCRRPACVRPDHLEPVTPAENVRRGLSGRLREWPTHCRRGHDLSEGNYYERKRPDGSVQARACKQCQHVSNARWRSKQAKKLAEQVPGT